MVILFPCFQYKATDMVFDGPGKFQILWTPEGGSETKTDVFTFKNGGGCGMAMYNTDEVLFFFTDFFINCLFSSDELDRNFICWFLLKKT